MTWEERVHDVHLTSCVVCLQVVAATGKRDVLQQRRAALAALEVALRSNSAETVQAAISKAEQSGADPGRVNDSLKTNFQLGYSMFLTCQQNQILKCSQDRKSTRLNSSH